MEVARAVGRAGGDVELDDFEEGEVRVDSVGQVEEGRADGDVAADPEGVEAWAAHDAVQREAQAVDAVGLEDVGGRAEGARPSETAGVEVEVDEVVGVQLVETDCQLVAVLPVLRQVLPPFVVDNDAHFFEVGEA